MWRLMFRMLRVVCLSFQKHILNFALEHRLSSSLKFEGCFKKTFLIPGASTGLWRSCACTVMGQKIVSIVNYFIMILKMALEPPLRIFKLLSKG